MINICEVCLQYEVKHIHWYISVWSFDEECHDDNPRNNKVYTNSYSEYSGNYDMILTLRHYIFVVTNIDALVAIQWLIHKMKFE